MTLLNEFCPDIITCSQKHKKSTSQPSNLKECFRNLKFFQLKDMVQKYEFVFFSVSESLTHLESFIPRSLPTKSKIDFLYEAYTNKKSYFCHKNQSDSDRHNILLNGIYALYLKHWFKTFRRDQILVLDGQKLLSEPAKILKVYVFCRNCSFYTLRMQVNISLNHA